MFLFLLQFRNLLQTLLNLESNREFWTLEDDVDKNLVAKKTLYEMQTKTTSQVWEQNHLIQENFYFSVLEDAKGTTINWEIQQE